MSTRLLPTFHLLVGILVSMALAMADIFETEPLSMLHPVRDLGFRPVNRSGIAAPNWSRWKKLGPIEAFPTNEFWQNVAIGKGNDRSNNIAQLPYVLQVDERDLLVMYPWTLESSDREYLNAFDDVVEPIRLSAVEAQMSKYPFDYYITRYDPVSVSIQWSSTPENNTYRSFSSVIVRGSPYITMQYFGLSPLISLQQELLPGSVYVDGVLASSTICDGSSFLAKTFQFAVIESDTTWKIWFPRSLEMTCSPIKFSLQSREEISGYIRVALVNNCTTGHSKQHCPLNSLEAYNMSEYAKLLDDHVAAIPIAGKIGYHKVPAPEKNSDIAVELVFDWTIHVWNSSYDETSSLLMLALPHHMSLLERNKSQVKVVDHLKVHKSIRGFQTPVIGNQWFLVQTIPNIDFKVHRQIESSKVDEIRKALEADKFYDPPVNYQEGVGDPYYAGKLLARMGRLVVIADELGEKDYVLNITHRMMTYLKPWLLHTGPNELTYDASWGGIISCGCVYDDCFGKCKPFCSNAKDPSSKSCPAHGDVGFDFGNAFYNDHHFHYGYFIYASAILAKYYPHWNQDYQERVLVWIRDIANPSERDVYFPQYRYMDFYEGHSWALGTALGGGTPFVNGKDQESTSEAVNAWYGIYLFGLAVENEQVETLGLMLLTTEILGAQTYWQITDESSVYPDIYKKNHIVGILWQHLAQYQTFFSASGWAIHGIQQLPYTPISEALLNPHWMKQAFPGFEEACAKEPQCEEEGWGTYVELARSINDPDTAWNNALKLPDRVFDNKLAGGNGNSRTNTLHFIASRPKLSKAIPKMLNPPLDSIAEDR